MLNAKPATHSECMVGSCLGTCPTHRVQVPHSWLFGCGARVILVRVLGKYLSIFGTWTLGVSLLLTSKDTKPISQNQASKSGGDFETVPMCWYTEN